ncbi:MAG TPA: hypothetical protein VEX37_00125, partial [Thermomicrobiales bacterium]|nr:hypothetical protein [Thermomicrobiales bacterium]
QTAVAIAIITSAAIGVTTAAIVRDATDDDAGRAVIVTSATANREEAVGYQFLEQNLDLPTGVAAPAVNRYTDYQFMEQNLNLPGNDIAPARGSTMDYRFLEMNLELPGTATSVETDWRMIEQNSWGEGFVLDGSNSQSAPPSETEVLQKHTPESSY